MIKLLLAVSLGGMVGTLLRFGTGLLVAGHWPRYAYLGTLLVNLVGCMAIGFLHGFFLQRTELPQELRTGLMVGLLGGLTTFSSFSLDTLRLMENGQVATALGYLALSVGGGLMAAWLGLSLTRL